MAAEAVQQIRAGLQRRKEIETAVGAAGALAAAVPQVDHEAGAGVFFTEPGGHNAHHALVPRLAGEDLGAALLCPEIPDLLHGIGADGLLHSLALPVQVAQGPGQLLRPGGIVRFQQVCRQVCGAHAAGCVDPGREDETDLDGGDGAAQETGLLQQGVDAHKVRMGQGLQSAGDDGAVLPLHAHDIGNGADGGQRAVPGEQGILPAFSAQGQHQLQRHADAR